MLKGFLVTILAGFYWLPAGAMEGFFPKNGDLPAQVSASWNSVFAFYGQATGGEGLGTFSLISTKIEGGKVYAYFIGARHVTANVCPQLGICHNSYLAQDLEVKPLPSLTFSISSIVALFKGPEVRPSGPIFREPKVIAVASDQDLVMLKVAVDTDHVSPIDVVPLANDCDLKPLEKVYTIGFSAVMDRTTWHVKPPEDPGIIKKRWSMGELSALIRYQADGSEKLFLGTSVDVLYGGSGGPLLTSNGELIGVLSMAADNNGGEYSTKAADDKVETQSFSVMCDEVRRFIFSVPEVLAN